MRFFAQMLRARVSNRAARPEIWGDVFFQRPKGDAMSRKNERIGDRQPSVRSGALPDVPAGPLPGTPAHSRAHRDVPTRSGMFPKTGLAAQTKPTLPLS